MFKKTLLAAAMTLAVAGQANAFSVDGVNDTNDGIQAQAVAIQSTPAVLQFQAGNGANTYSVTPAKAAVEEVKNEEGKVTTPAAPAVAGDLNPNNFIRIELTNNATWNLAEVQKLAPATGVDTDGAKTLVSGSEDGTAFNKAVVDYTQAALIAPNVLKLPIKLAEAADAENISNIKVNMKPAGLFNLTKATTGTVNVKVAIQDMNGSFVDEPIVAKNPAFAMVNVLGASMTNSTENGFSTKEAKVTYQYKQFNLGDETVDTTMDAAKLFITNNTSDQVVNGAKVTLSIHGDFSDIVASSYTDEGWKLTGNDKSVITKTLSDSITETKTEMLPAFEFTGENPIKAQEFTVDVAMASNATFNAYDIKDIEAYKVTRDGFSFETVTTGTTASNQIFIRDVSGKLPKEGAAINVTITEYVNGEGKVIADTLPLKTKLMNNGAVTLTPAQITDELGVAATPASQARFEFFVETEEGRAAVKKQQAGVGIDIQTADERQQGNVL